MKKLMTSVLASCIVCFTACGSTGTSAQKEQQAATGNDSRVVVAYFSATGTTKAVAQQLAEATKGRLVEITPEAPYTDADLDWHNTKSRSSVEMADMKSRPAIVTPKLDANSFDVIYIGFPIWWYTAPTIVNTFIEANDLKGKKIIPFATSGGSTIDKSCADLKATYPDLNICKGRLLNSPSKEEIASFAKMAE